MAQAFEDRFLTMPQMVERCGLTRWTIYKAMDAGLLRYHTPAGMTRKRLVRLSDFDAWIEGAPRNG